ncbi:putative membrane protein [hydrothermal vent metagenome]|uniref:Putative membrane protein n=1 Tax=hydrothermal vent metagenome TaxID=652676 RepID=A0A3B0SUC9_9ZZZZ
MSKTAKPKSRESAFLAPTKLAILSMSAGVPVTLLLSIFAPALWALGAAWIAFLLALIVLDALLSPGLFSVSLTPVPPRQVYIGDSAKLLAHIEFTGKAPAFVEVTTNKSTIAQLTPARVLAQTQNAKAVAQFDIIPKRRGQLHLSRFWLRWRGPLGLVFKARTMPQDMHIPVIANIRGVKQQAMQIFSRDQRYGQKRQKERGEGTEFDSLREFVSGMDHRRIDWKASARHHLLLAKEFRTERNHNVMIALDTGYLMSAPLDGIAKLDHGLNAGLLLAYIGLRTGDRVGLYSFDAQPGLICKPLAHTGSFGVLQRLSAGIGYSNTETNFTLGLSRLGQSLDRRSLLIIFTDFSDTISAELMLENLGRLVRNHVVIFIAFNDKELEDMVTAAPDTTEKISQAVIAAGLLKERDLVFSRLHRLGVHILETQPERVGPKLLAKYMELKTRGVL